MYHIFQDNSLCVCVCVRARQLKFSAEEVYTIFMISGFKVL